MDSLNIRVLGALHVERNGQLVTDFKTDATRALLGLLAFHNGVQRRDVLATRLASEGKTNSAALKYLRLNLDRLRRALQDRTSEPAFLAISRKEIGLADHVWVDALAFERLLAEVAQHPHREATQCPTCLAKLTEAVALYRGDVLAGLNFESPAWQTWLREIRSQKQQQAIDALTTLTQWRYEQAARGQGEWREVLETAQTILRVEAWHEQAHRWTMEAFWQMGQVGEAMAQYEQCAAALDEALSIAPNEETEVLRQRIAGFADRDSAEIDTPHNLPEARTAFFGRSHELTQLQTMLTDPLYRLISVVGEGGMGKSRLAQEVGWQLRPSFPDGVWFVPLAGVTTSDGTIAAIAQALDFTFRQGPPPLQQLLRFLRHAELLLILDNFEQLVDESEVLLEILNKASGVVLLCTSRQMLNLTEEIVLPLRGLEMKRRERNQTLDVMQPAIQLFAARARRSDARFVLDDETAETVEQIALLLEGNPLGLELAASWARSRTTEQILVAIEDSADFLATRRRDIPQRHRTMRAVFETSWGLLSADEQALYPKLTLFRGGFSLAAAVAITQADRDILDQLIEKSMLRFERGRYDIHELLRSFAGEHLIGRMPVETAFITYYADYLEHYGNELLGYNVKQARSHLLRDESNIQQMWHYAIQHQSAKLTICIDHLGRYYGMVGQPLVYQALMKQAIDIFGSDTPFNIRLHYLIASTDYLNHSEVEAQLRELYRVNPTALCCICLGRSLIRTGKMAEAVDFLEESIEKARTTGQPRIETQALHQLGIATQIGTDDNEATLKHFTAAVRRAHSAGLVYDESFLLIDLGQIYYLQDAPDQALEVLDRGLALAKRLDAWLPMLTALHILASVTSELRQFTLATRYFKEATAQAEILDDSFHLSMIRQNMARQLLRQGQLTEAEKILQREINQFRQLNDTYNESFGMRFLGSVFYAQNKPARALECFESSLNLMGESVLGKSDGWFVMGNALIALERLDEAAHYFEQAIVLNQQSGKPQCVAECQIGLAEVRWRQHRRAELLAAAQPAATFVDSGHSLFGCRDDLQMLWRLYVVLEEPRWLEQAHALLMERAAQFGDGTPEQHTYLHNLPVHRRILERTTGILACPPLADSPVCDTPLVLHKM